MIISKTPLRISFVGGGSDIIRKNQKNFGSVISTTINKYVYVIINKKSDKKIRVSYSKTENENNINKIKHPIIKACLKLFNIKEAIEVVTVADIPSNGSGLGSSSSLTVGLLNALSVYKKKKISKYNLAKLAYHIESKILKKTLGYQDQFNAAYGGLNYFKFYKNHRIVRNSIKLEKKNIQEFKKNLILIDTGKSRLADKILKNLPQKKNTYSLNTLSGLSKKFHECLMLKKFEEIGKMIDFNWEIKKKLDKKVSNKQLNKIYDTAKKNGAIGGKILGAGGGGYFLFYAKPKFQKKIITALKKYNVIDFNFSYRGSEIIYNDTD